MRRIWWLASVLFLPAAPAWSFDSFCPYGGQNQKEIAQVLRIDDNAVPDLAARYCGNVGKSAYNAVGPDRVRNIALGPILGVTWVNAGDRIFDGDSGLIVARYSGFMYVIGPGGVSDRPFLRWASDIEGR